MSEELEQAKNTLKWAFQRMDWFKLDHAANAMEVLGPDAIAALREVVAEKRQRAILRGDVYVPAGEHPLDKK